jgi:hypothetical protein
MRVIPESAIAGREVYVSKHAGSTVLKGTEGATTFLCGSCRDVIVKNRGRDEPFVFEAVEPFKPVYTLADVVFRCKGCGAYNEVPQMRSAESASANVESIPLDPRVGWRPLVWLRRRLAR